MTDFKFEYREGDEVECRRALWNVERVLPDSLMLSHGDYAIAFALEEIKPLNEASDRYNRKKAEHDAKQVPDLVEGDFKIVGDDLIHTHSSGDFMWGKIDSIRDGQWLPPFGYMPTEIREVETFGLHTADTLRDIANLLDRYEARRK